jgi:pSer/pThr/pTyr-binding forkhead associated (FHA) protein
VSLFEKLFSRSKREGRTAREAREREEAGDLGAAADLYAEAGLGDEAARVLLLRADAEPSVEKRIAYCARAAQRAESEEVRRKARGRKALLAFDTLKRSGGSFLPNEVLAVARELEDTGELERAADAYSLGGDQEGEVRALTAAGAIERLEERLRQSERDTRSEREAEQRLRRIADLDRTAERRAALDLCRVALAVREDPKILEAARAIRARLLHGPVVDLEIDGELRRYALGREVTIGRGEATIVLGSRAVSRRHLRLARGPAGVFVEDLGTRNGTVIAGARIAGPIPVGDGLRLVLGSEVPCAIIPLALMPDAPTPLGPALVDQCFAVEIAGWRYLCPLGPLSAGGWQIGIEPGPIGEDEPFVVLSSAGARARPLLGDFELATRVELCHGDEIRAARGGRVVLRVPGAGARQPDEDTGPTHTSRA